MSRSFQTRPNRLLDCISHENPITISHQYQQNIYHWYSIDIPLCLIFQSCFWVNYNDLTAASLEIMVSKGNHPQMAELFRLVKYYNFPLIYHWYSIDIPINIPSHVSWNRGYTVSTAAQAHDAGAAGRGSLGGSFWGAFRKWETFKGKLT